MVLISNRYKFIFIKTKKTAGTSVEGLLEKYCLDSEDIKTYVQTHKRDSYRSEGGFIGPRDRGKTEPGWNEHMEAKQIKRRLNNKFNRLYKFTVVRNPWDKMVSMYFHVINRTGITDGHKHLKNLTFAKFISMTTHSIDHYIYHIDQKQVCDFHIRYENLEEDLTTLATTLKLPDFDISNLPVWKSEYRTDNGIHYSQYYTPELREKVAKLYAREIAEFGYTFESHVKQKIDKIEEKVAEE